jgi:multidrug efflux pump subunit AcrB
VLQGRDASASIGEKTIDGAAGNLKVTANISDIDTLARLPVGSGVKLSDVADVKLDTAQENVTRVDGKDVQMITITKGANANSVAVGKSAVETADRLTKEWKDAEVNVVMNTSEQIEHSVNSMLREVLLGALFATIVILLFMRNFRVTVVTIVSIPLSLAITLYLLNLSGVTLNIITLGGVAVAVGRLVDDSIVVIENIYRRLQKEAFSVQMIIESVKEVSTAITSSTLTTVAVFLPMGLLRGSLQAFLLPFALTVTYSLLVALTIVPLLSAALLKNTKLKQHDASVRFTSFLNWNLNRKWLPITIAVLLFAGSIVGYVSLPKGAIDASDATNLLVTLEYPTQTPGGDVLEQGKKLESFLVKQQEPKWVAMTMGNSADGAKYGSVSSPTLVTYQLEIKKGENAENLIGKIKQQRANYTGAELNAGPMNMMSGASSTDIFIDITGDDPQQLTAASETIMAKVRDVKDVLKVKSNQEQKKPVYTFEVDPAKAKASEIAMQLQGMLNAVPVGQLSVGSLISDVLLQPIVDPQNENELNNLTVMTDQGPVPVTSVARLVKSEEPSVFYHKNGKTYVRVTATADPSQLSIVGANIDKALKDIKLPDGVDMFVGGASADQAGDFATLGMTALISIFIVYLIMVVTFKTLRGPLAILFSLPLAAIGAVLGLMISGVSPDFTAAFGALMLIGVVVTNAIVLIDRVKQNEQHMTIREALLEAAGTRMRPILMTAIATICAMLPLVFGSSESGSIVSQSLAIVVIGGLTVATALTLVIVPCMYELLFARQARKQRRTLKEAGITA